MRVAVKHKVASVRSETLSWLAFCLEHSTKDVVVKVFKEYMPLFVEVRESFNLERRGC